MRDPLKPIRITAKRKNAVLDFFNAYKRCRFHDYPDPKIRPFESAKSNGASVLVDGVIFQEAWASTDNEMSWSDPGGAWQVLMQRRSREMTYSHPQRTELGAFYEMDVPAAFKVNYGTKNDGTPNVGDILLWVRADDQSAVFTNLTKWLADKAYWLKLLSA